MTVYNPPVVAFASSLRGLAALAVVFAHHLGVFWLGRQWAAAQALITELPASVATPPYVYLTGMVPTVNWGIFGVAVFFLVSGFVIPFSFQRSTGPVFLVGRFFRLWPTYAVGFTITLAALATASRYFGTAWPFTKSQITIQYLLGLRDLLWSLNIDPIVWTLEVEIKFYVLCAVLAPLLRSHSKAVFVAPLVIFALAAAFWHFAEQLRSTGGYYFTLPFTLSSHGQYIIFMFIGVAFHYAHVGKFSPQQLLCTVAALFWMLAYLWGKAFMVIPFKEAWSFGVAVLVFAAAASFPTLLDGRVLRFLADISYPLYVVHCVVGYVSLAILLDMGVSPLTANVTVFGFVILLAYLIHVTIEVPSHTFGRSVMTRLGRVQSGRLAAASPS